MCLINSTCGRRLALEPIPIQHSEQAANLSGDARPRPSAASHGRALQPGRPTSAEVLQLLCQHFAFREC